MCTSQMSIFSRLLGQGDSRGRWKTFDWQEWNCTTGAHISTTAVNTQLDGHYAVVCVYVQKWVARLRAYNPEYFT